MTATILSNARLVLSDHVATGSLRFDHGRLTGFDPGSGPDEACLDMDGDLLIPGIVDLHTDNLERQVEPRPNARWPSRAAMLAHDAQCAAAGVTTVLDALCLGDLGFEPSRLQTFRDGVADGDALHPTGLLKSEHFLHLRCELPARALLALFDSVAAHPRLRMASLMDHTPGAGQFGDLAAYRALRRRDGLDEAAVERRIHDLLALRAEMREPNRRALLNRLRGSGIVLASHDDRTEAEIDCNHRDGIAISEFPVSIAAARAAKACGMSVVAGAPNVVRGGSHSGNVAARTLLDQGLVDALASDYVPASLLDAAFRCAAAGMALPEAIALVTARPAALIGLDDRGRLAPGLRADVVRVRLHDGVPVVRQVWRAGERVI